MGAKIRGVVWGQNLHECILHSHIRNSDLQEGIFCLGEGSGGKGRGKWGKGEGSGGKGEVGIRGREVGNAYPRPPPHEC